MSRRSAGVPPAFRAVWVSLTEEEEAGEEDAGKMPALRAALRPALPNGHSSLRLQRPALTGFSSM